MNIWEKMLMATGWIVVLVLSIVLGGQLVEADTVLLVSGWMAAFVVVMTWAYEKYQRGELKDLKSFGTFIINWLEAAAKDPHIRTRIDAQWDASIKPALNKFIEKVAGPGSPDASEMIEKIKTWGELPWDEEPKKETE